MITRKSYHSHELALKLKQKEHPPEEIQQSIAYLVDLGYLNDEEYLRSFSKKALEKGWSPLEIKSKLYQRGIKGEPEYNERLSMIQYVKKKKFKDPLKMKQTLYRKGFSSDSINGLLGND